MQLHGKVVVFEGDVKDVTAFIRREMPCHQTLSLRDYFKEEVWGVYKEGEENFRYYYQCLGNGKYSVFIMRE